MSTRDYPRLGIEEFGKHLLVSGDLDPVYISLSKVGWSTAQVKRWLMAYVCLYHCGAASYISGSEGRRFWDHLGDAAANEKPAPSGGRWPRGHERRHWRGGQAMKSWAELVARYENPEGFFDYLAAGGSSYASVAARVQEHRGFGPWISFKCCDLLDRVLGYRVEFTEADTMYKDPTEAALMFWRAKAGYPRDATPKDKSAAVHLVLGHLESTFAGMTAPPEHDRALELNEFETILCKWKSHMNGHYPLNNDTDEINLGLKGWGAAAAEFGEAMPVRMTYEEVFGRFAFPSDPAQDRT